MPYVRTVKTDSARRRCRSSGHCGAVRGRSSTSGPRTTTPELEPLKAAAGQRIAAGQTELDLGLGDSGAAGPLPITSSRMGCLLDALDRGYRVLGLDEAAGGDGVFRQLVLARIIEPASKIDSFEPTQAGNVGSAACAS